MIRKGVISLPSVSYSRWRQLIGRLWAVIWEGRMRHEQVRRRLLFLIRHLDKRQPYKCIICMESAGASPAGGTNLKKKKKRRRNPRNPTDGLRGAVQIKRNVKFLSFSSF